MLLLLLIFIAPFWAVVEAIKTGFLGDDDDDNNDDVVVLCCRHNVMWLLLLIALQSVNKTHWTVIVGHGALFCCRGSKSVNPVLLFFVDLVRPFIFFVAFLQHIVNFDCSSLKSSSSCVCVCDGPSVCFG